MIEKLDVQNFTALPNAAWSFTPGLNVVVGENGLGKTHVMKLLYTLLKVQADAKDLSKSVLERAYAEKLTAVFRPESLGRLVKRRQGRARCEFRLSMSNDGLSMAGAFASNAKSQVEIVKAPTEGLARSPAYLPTRELVTLCPWFVPLYDNYHLEFEETWRDTVSLLGNPSLKGSREKRAAELLTPLEQDGFVFITTNRVSGSDGSVVLTGIHEIQPQGFSARLKALPMVFFKGVIKKAILQDLKDIKKVVERG